MFDATFFDEEFYRSKTGKKGAKRDRDYTAHGCYASDMSLAFGLSPRPRLLDIGAGIGARTMAKIFWGFDATCCDVSQWGKDNSVVPDRHILADVRELSAVCGENTYDIVNVERIICYLPECDARKALEEIGKVSRKWVVLCIIVSDHKDPEIPIKGAPGRLNINTKAYWEAHCMDLGWKLDEEKTGVMLRNGADGIWVWEVPK